MKASRKDSAKQDDGFAVSLKKAYTSPRKPTLIDVGTGRYLAVSGKGRPGGDLYTERVGALYGMAYTIKMTRKFDGLQDYPVWKLECVYKNLGGPAIPPLDEWEWELMIRTPEFVGQGEVDQAREKLAKRGKGASTEHVALRNLEEGPCIQMLHIGPYDQEAPTLAAMRDFAAGRGLRPAGTTHHEIYLSDPRRVEPTSLRTILRTPVVPAT